MFLKNTNKIVFIVASRFDLTETSEGRKHELEVSGKDDDMPSVNPGALKRPKVACLYEKIKQSQKKA